MLGCIADYGGALHWIEENADKIDTLPDLEVTHRSCCADFTPLDMAIITNRRDLVDKLIARGARADRLEYMLVHTGWKSEEIIDLCYQGVGTTPGFDILTRSILEKNLSALTWLLDHGGDPNDQQPLTYWENHGGTRQFGPSLLEVALSCENPEGVALLLNRGAIVDPKAMDRLLLTTNGAEAISGLFSAHGHGARIDLNARYSGGETLLWKVCSGLYQGKQRAALVRLLIEQGADVNVAADTGLTPLMFASTLGDLDTLHRLLKAGADPEARDNEGRTALDFAQMRGKTNVADILLTYIEGKRRWVSDFTDS